MPPKPQDDDDLDDEEFTDNVGGDEAAILQQQKAKESEVTGLLNKGDAAAALKAAVQNPPITSGDAKTKKVAADSFYQVAAAIKEADLKKAIDGFSEDELVTLMKYVFQGLSQNKNQPTLLKAHEAVVEKGGLGVIMRVLTDRRTVA